MTRVSMTADGLAGAAGAAAGSFFGFRGMLIGYDKEVQSSGSR
jgi:hypothetical protein